MIRRLNLPGENMLKKKLYGFKYDNKTYVSNENIDLIKKLCSNMNIGVPAITATNPSFTMTESGVEYYNNDWIVVQSV